MDTQLSEDKSLFGRGMTAPAYVQAAAGPWADGGPEPGAAPPAAAVATIPQRRWLRAAASAPPRARAATDTDTATALAPPPPLPAAPPPPLAPPPPPAPPPPLPPATATAPALCTGTGTVPAPAPALTPTLCTEPAASTPRQHG